MGTIKDRNSKDLTEVKEIKKRWQELTEDKNGMDLTEAEHIKKGWKEHTEELYKKDLHDPDNHDGVTTHLEPDTLEQS